MEDNNDYKTFFAKSEYYMGDIVNIEIKSWVSKKNKTDDNKEDGISGKIKQKIYDFLSLHNISLYIIDLKFKQSLIQDGKPTFFKLNLMFNPNKMFNEKNISFFYNMFNLYLENNICLSFSKDKKN